jgi:hypothetical protein
MEYDKIDGIPFRDKLTERLLAENPRLYEKRKDELGDPYMQTALWVIMDVVMARKQAKQASVYNEQMQAQLRGS